MLTRVPVKWMGAISQWNGAVLLSTVQGPVQILAEHMRFPGTFWEVRNQVMAPVLLLTVDSVAAQ